MHTRILALALGAIALGSAASAQDTYPYFQSQRSVVIFKVEERLAVKRMDGSEVEVLDEGYYRFEAKHDTQAVLRQDSLNQTYGAYYRGQGEITGLFSGAAKREASITIKPTAADFGGRRNVLDAAELTIGFRVQLDAMSSTAMRMTGDVARTGAFVPGELDNYYSANGGKIKVYHAFLSVENHLPQVKPPAFFPAALTASAAPTPKDEIEAGPYVFDLVRAEQTDLGVQRYDSSERFPKVHESDYYGHYVSGASTPQILVKEDGNVWVRFGWGLSGRYHGWSHRYTATLTPAQLDALKTNGRLRVSGSADYSYAGEDDAFEVESTCEITLELAPAAVPSGGLAGAVGGQ